MLFRLREIRIPCNRLGSKGRQRPGILCSKIRLKICFQLKSWTRYNCRNRQEHHNMENKTNRLEPRRHRGKCGSSSQAETYEKKKKTAQGGNTQEIRRRERLETVDIENEKGIERHQ